MTTPSGSKHPMAALRFVLYVVGLVIAGCASGPEKKEYVLPGATDFTVDRIILRGVESFEVDDIKSGLVTQEDPGWRTSISWMPLLGADNAYYNYVEWERDLQRIETFYKARGYFDARIVSKNFVQNDEEKSVRLTVTVSEGDPTEISTIQFSGLDGPRLNAQELRGVLPLRVGERFVESTYTQSKEILAASLEEKSFAYAQVRGSVLVDPETRKARITYFIDAGPPSVFGPITVEGLERVADEHVQRATTIQEGAPYDPTVMQESQEALYDLRVFSLVKVSTRRELDEFEAFGANGAPEEQEEESEEDSDSEALGISQLVDAAQNEAEERLELDPVVPIVVRVKENPPWNLRLGLAAEAEVNRQALQALANWSNPNIFGTFWRVDHFNSVGYAWAPDFFEPLNEGIIGSSELRLTRPQFLERLTTFKSRIRFEREIYEGYNLISPGLKFGVERSFFKHLHLELSYNFKLNQLTSINPSLVASDVFIEDYILEYLEQRIRLDFRDNFLNPTRGWQIELVFQEAFGYLTLGEPKYLKIIAGAETYFPFDLGVKQVLGLKLRAASLYNMGGDSDIPVPEKIYAGGIDSMRSFGRRQISFWTQSGQALEVGATSKLEASVEHRFRLSKDFLEVGDLWGAIFLDAATVSLGQLYLNTGNNRRGTTTLTRLADDLLYGLGGGLFWMTPIGPVRFDLAFTLSNIEDDPKFRRCQTGRFACNPEDRVPLEDDPIQERISGFGFFIGIGHSF